jgi:hypothetical protein
MGVFHFAGLGRSPGAVTSGLSFLNHKYSGSHEYAIQGVVLFTSPEVADGTVPAFDSEHNEYMSLTVRETWPRSKKNAVEVVVEFFKREIGRGSIYLCPVNVNDFSACFEAVVKATLRFHRPGDVGKHIWANITGGTNPLNAALFQTAYLSGFIARLYYTFVSDLSKYGKYLQPFSRDQNLFDFREIYVLKTTFDDRYQHILEELEAVTRKDPTRWLTSEELLRRLKSKGVPGFQEMDARTFLLDFLHVMQGRGLQRRDKDNAIRLDPEVGSAILRILRSDLVQALFKPTALNDNRIEQLTCDLVIRELWSEK